MSLRCLIVAAGAAAVLSIVGSVGAVELYFSHPYGEIVDRGNLSAQIQSSSGVGFECPTSVAYAQSGNRITLAIRRAPPGQADTGACRFTASVVLGAMPAGDYEVTAQVNAQEGAVVESITQPLRVLPIAGRCNADPLLSPSIVATLKSQSPAQFIARLASDRAYAASLGNPAARTAPFSNDIYLDFPPLDDIPPAMDRLTQSGEFNSMWRNGRACFAAPPPDASAQFVEFYHAGLDHYFYSGNAVEIAAVDAGNVGAGWSRTGKSFRAVTEPGCAFSTTDTVVYRFFGIPGVGPNSHFFTRDRAECHLVDQSAQWSLEGVPLWATEPRSDGTCPAPFAQTRIPLYRAWRPFGDSNHRFTTERAVVNEMVGKGWIDEGPVMCVLPPV